MRPRGTPNPDNCGETWYTEVGCAASGDTIRDTRGIGEVTAHQGRTGKGHCRDALLLEHRHYAVAAIGDHRPYADAVIGDHRPYPVADIGDHRPYADAVIGDHRPYADVNRGDRGQ